MRGMTEQEALEEYYRYLQKEYEKEYILYEDSWGNTLLISESDKQKIDIAKFLIDRPYSMSLRKLSREFGIPKSTIWDWFHKDLKHLDDDLYCQCKRILSNHKK